MRFEAVADEKATFYFIDGYPVPKEVYDAFFPSKLFPGETIPLEKARAQFAEIKAGIDALPPVERAMPHFALSITNDRPILSDALAVHPDQRDAVIARNKRHGLTGVDYDHHGRPVLTDPNQRRKLMKIEGVRDRNSAYGH